MSVSAQDGPPEGLPTPQGSAIPLSVLAWWAPPLLCAAIVGGSAFLATAARGDILPPHTFEMFSGAAGSPTMTREFAFGPFATAARCFSAARSMIEQNATAQPGRTFMGRCDGGVLLTADEISRRARDWQ